MRRRAVVDEATARKAAPWAESFILREEERVEGERERGLIKGGDGRKGETKREDCTSLIQSEKGA